MGLRFSVHLIFAGFLTVIAMPVSAKAQGAPQGALRNETPWTIEGFSFPAAIAGLTRLSRHQFDQPGYGFSVRYSMGRTTWADVYVYDKSLDLTSAPETTLKQEMMAVIREILIVQDKDGYETKVEAVGVESGVAFAHITAKVGGKDRRSSAYLAILKGKFVKVRFSTLDRQRGAKLADTFSKRVFDKARATSPAPKRDPRYI